VHLVDLREAAHQRIHAAYGEYRRIGAAMRCAQGDQPLDARTDDRTQCDAGGW